MPNNTATIIIIIIQQKKTQLSGKTFTELIDNCCRGKEDVDALYFPTNSQLPSSHDMTGNSPTTIQEEPEYSTFFIVRVQQCSYCYLSPKKQRTCHVHCNPLLQVAALIPMLVSTLPYKCDGLSQH